MYGLLIFATILTILLSYLELFSKDMGIECVRTVGGLYRQRQSKVLHYNGANQNDAHFTTIMNSRHSSKFQLNAKSPSHFSCHRYNC